MNRLIVLFLSLCTQDNSKSDTADDDDAKLMTILSNPPDEIELPSDAEGDLITNNNNDAEEGSSLAKELFILQAEIDRLEETGEPIPENERPKRTLRYISRLFCSVLRSIVPFCASTTTTSAPPTNGEGGSGDEDDDNFWLDYLNSNTTTTTTTPRPAFGTLAWKRQQLARFFPRLFGWLGRSGGGSGDGSFLLNLLSAPLRAFRRLNLGGLLGGRGGANSGS